MKACPYCAEQIQDAAVRCRFCSKDIPPPGADPIKARQARRTAGLALGFVFFGLFGWGLGGALWVAFDIGSEVSWGLSQETWGHLLGGLAGVNFFGWLNGMSNS